MRKAAIIVDVQNDFCKGGALAVPGGEEVVPLANDYILKGNYDLLIATQDWHPQNHGSFASNHPGAKPFDMGELGGKPQVLWPDHCIQGSHGARFHPDLILHQVTIFRKGMDPTIDSYSGFYDNDRKKSTGLAEFLDKYEILFVDVFGLATDYCVSATALDGIREGYNVNMFLAASRGIAAESIDKAVKQMRDAGVKVV